MQQVVSSEFKLGIITGGQLGKMLTLAAKNWDVQTYIMDTSKNCPSANSCNKVIIGDYTSFDDVYNFGKQVDMVTIEIENVNADALLKLKNEGKKVYPDPQHLKLIQDKGLQKQFYEKHSIPTSPFQLFNSAEEIQKAVKSGAVSLPFVQKTRTAGYDGKGVFVVKEEEDLDNLLQAPSVVEHKVNIEKEIAVIVCKSTTEEVKTFPAVEMEFNPTANLVEFLICPANISKELEEEAAQLAETVIKTLNMEGILAVEMFLDKNGKLLVNEVAPRPHNSGHHTIESAFTSQYEQHLRAIFGFPLGSTELKIPSVMINILGSSGYEGKVKYEGLNACMGVEGIKLHIYGKKETRPFRKMGHATILNQNIEKAKENARFVQQNLKVIS